MGNGIIQLKVKYYLKKDKAVLVGFMTRNKVRVNSFLEETNTIYIECKVDYIKVLAKNNLIQWIEPISAPDIKEDQEGRNLHRSNTISTEYFSGRKYDGTGVVVGLADDGVIGPHIDYQGRLTQHTSTGSGSHGDMTSGIIFGAGNLDPKIRGMATGANMHYYKVVGYPHVKNGVANMTTLGTVITSTSFGKGKGGKYTSDTEFIDQQINQNPNIIHVFSAGNSGISDHGYGAGAGWANITGGYKAGKNVIASGNLNSTDILENSSSRGPANDGRIKPDLCANGIGQMSTAENNSYQIGGGTSAACPGIAGVIAQLYQAFKDVNAGVNPASGLIKATLLNTAEDLGNPGPDFKHGWGRINALKAVRTIEENRYFTNFASQGSKNRHNITVPANVRQLRIMTYWMDVEGNPIAAKALVNDINMQVLDPVLTSYNPWVLDPSPNAANLDLDAVRGIDDLNNVEQVSIVNPVAGSYTVNINGFSIPQGPQKYFVLYDFIFDGVELTYPIGREGFNPGSVERIRWDSYGVSGTFNLEYSTDNGVGWNTIVGTVNSSDRYHDWTVPSSLSGEVLVRVTRGAFSDVSDAVFSIIPTPVNLTIDWVCPDSMQLSWNPVAGATSYEASMLGTKYMDSVGITSTNSYVFHGVNPNQNYWLSVRSLGPKNARGERAIAIEKVSGTFNCPIAVDVSLSEIKPQDQAQLSECVVGKVIDVTTTIKNEGLSPISNVPVHYSLNGGAAVNEIYVGLLVSGVSASYTFSTQITASVGNNDLLVWSDLNGDGNFYNDSTTSQFTYLAGMVQSLPWGEDFESFPLCRDSIDCELEVCALSNEFINESNGIVDHIDWRTDSGGTPTKGTGPGTGNKTGQPDFNPGTSSGKYLYLESSSGCNNQAAFLVSPCIDLRTTVNPELIFAYSMYGVNIASLSVDVFSNGIWNNNIMAPINGNQGQGWFQKTVNLSAYVGEVINVRFRGMTGSDSKADMAIDDINISESTGINDITNDLNFSIFPNPSNGVYNYTYSGKTALTVELYDVNGKTIHTDVIAEDSSIKNGVIDIRDYADGIYMIVLTSDSKRATKRIIKK